MAKSSTIMIGQVPVVIEGEEDLQSPLIEPSSAASNGQTSNSNEATDVLPSDGNGYSYRSDDGESDNEREPKSGRQDQEQTTVNNDDGASAGNPSKRKRYHRHTAHQIHAMEALFKECPHPDDKQRKELSCALGLEPLQVKFWFQNKRTQIKTQTDRTSNAQLKAQNQRLRAENLSFRESLARGCCSTCGGEPNVIHSPIEANELRLENIKLKEELERMRALTAPFLGNSFANQNHNVIPNIPPVIVGIGQPEVVVDPSSVAPAYNQEPDFGAFGGLGQPEVEGDLLFEEELIMSFDDASQQPEVDKRRIIEVAKLSLEELNHKAQVEFPLWFPSIDQSQFLLDEDVYYEMFPRAADVKTPPTLLKTEGTRRTEIIMMNHLHLIGVLMDMEKFSAIFAGIVSKGMILDVISTGHPEDHDQSLIVMSAEFQALTPTVPTRESIFARHCRRLSEDTWGVVDVSLDNMYGTATGPYPNCHRFPSGCIIQALRTGGSKVTWIEHVGVENGGVHYLGKPFVDTQIAFGAQRWLAVLARQCERLATVAMTNFPPDDINNTVVPDPKTRRDILKLAERMVVSFCGGVTSSTAYSWLRQTGNGGEEVRFMTKPSYNGPDKPSGTIISATTSFWVPVPHKLVFEFLRDDNTRKEWDIMARTGAIQEFVHINNGHEVGNCVSMFTVNGTNTGPDMVILQECSTDPTASCMIYAPMDSHSARTLLGGEMPQNLELLPSGFTIYPCERPSPPPTLMYPGAGSTTTGSLVTVAFQVLVDPSCSTSMFSFGSVAIVNNVIESTVERIKRAMFPNIL